MTAILPQNNFKSSSGGGGHKEMADDVEVRYEED